MTEQQIIYVDVDDTLIRTFGTKQIPMTASIDFVRRMHAGGHVLYCWSRGGAKYAENVAASLELTDCFAAFLPKPDVLLDDQGEGILRHCEVILPANAANH